jgi:RHS repeat-associated protein
MRTRKTYDGFQRLTSISHSNSALGQFNTHRYTYNSANQRTAVTNADNSRWQYDYDALGQVTSGRKQWSDSTPVAGQQFEYAYDDIGNRKTAASGGDEWGANLDWENYTANALNQYTARTTPGAVNVLGAAHSNSTVTVNLSPATRKGEYFRARIAGDNTSSSLWLGLTNVGVLPDGTDPDIVTTNTGFALVPKAAETLSYDLDGNLLADSLWTNAWNAENRLVAVGSASGVPTNAWMRETWTHRTDGRWTERVVSAWNGTAYVPQFTNRFVWDGQALLAILDQANAVSVALMRGLDLSGSRQGAGGVGGVLAVNIATNGVQFAAYDGNGNIIALCGAADGAATATYEYSPFGQTLRAEGVVARANPIRWSTQFANDVTGTAKYLFRDYQMANGRWPNRDPLGEAGFEVIRNTAAKDMGAEPNRYSFTANNPISHFDSMGLKIYKCVRQAKTMENNLHAYLWNDKKKISCGRTGAIWATGEDADGDKGPGTPGHTCVEIPGSDGKEDAVMDCCFTMKFRPFFPLINDCHNWGDRCLNKNGLDDPPLDRFNEEFWKRAADAQQGRPVF